MIRAETYTNRNGWKKVRASTALRLFLSDGTTFDVEETTENGLAVLRVRGMGPVGVLFIKPEAANSITIRSGKRP